MRYILLFWALPMSLFWGWYLLSLNDLSFGYLFLSRTVHDFTFEIYGKILGIDPQLIPGLIARACVVDTLLIAALFAYRRRAAIRAWWRTRRAAEVAVCAD